MIRRTSGIADSRGTHRRGGRMGMALALLIVATAAPRPAPADQGPAEIHFPDDRRPPVLATFSLPKDLDELVVSPDGRHAAAAVRVEAARRDGGSIVQFYDMDRPEPVSVPLQGVVRDLLFLDGTHLCVIEHRPAKRGEGQSFLVAIDSGSPKARRLTRLPPSARSLEYWPARRSLLVAARNELRSFRLPLMRSGPLYRVRGENLALALIGETRLLVGQDDALLLIDLSDPQGRDSMPVRERAPTSTPLVSLAASSDGSSALARLADGRVVAIRFRPLSLTDAGTGLVLRRTGAAPSHAQAAASPVGPPPLPERPPEESPAAPEPSPGPAAEDPVSAPGGVAGTATAPAAVDRARPPIPEQPPAAPPPRRDPAAEPGRSDVLPPLPEPADDVSPTESTLPAPEGPVATAPGGLVDVQVRGRVEGPAAAHVVNVVLFGPDNLLREAARVRLGADGRFEVGGLSPGRYAIHLDAGGRRVLVSEPPIHTLELSEDGPVVADFRVQHAF